MFLQSRWWISRMDCSGELPRKMCAIGRHVRCYCQHIPYLGQRVKPYKLCFPWHQRLERISGRELAAPSRCIPCSFAESEQHKTLSCLTMTSINSVHVWKAVKYFDSRKVVDSEGIASGEKPWEFCHSLVIPEIISAQSMQKNPTSGHDSAGMTHGPLGPKKAFISIPLILFEEGNRKS